MSGAQAHHDFIASSSSSHSPAANTPPSAEDRDELDFLGQDDHDGLQDIEFDSRRRSAGERFSGDDERLYDDDPMHGDIGGTSFSFKPRPKPSLMSVPGRFLSSLTGGLSSTSDRSGSSTPLGGGHRGSSSPDHKDGQAAHDWYTEGPGRRVGYEDLTAIDWIFEYTKERQRLRVLNSSASGLMGYAQHLLDASQVWIILLLTGISVGAIAAFINIASDWLSDLKLGYCSSGPEGGHFYLNRGFCCYGYDAGYECDGWKTWGEAVGITAASGRWLVEYIFYLIIAVRACPTLLSNLLTNQYLRSHWRFALRSLFRSTPFTPSTVVFQRSRPSSVVSLSGGCWEDGLCSPSPSVWYVLCACYPT
jgi:chloride channel 3/4/5